LNGERTPDILIQRRRRELQERRSEEPTRATSNASSVTRKVTLREIAAREDTDEADRDLDPDHQDGIETEMIEDEEAEPLIDTIETGDTTEKDEIGIEAEGLLRTLDLTKGASEAEEATEETEIETTIEEIVIEIDTLMMIDAEEAEEVPEMEVTSLYTPRGHTIEVTLEEEAAKEERIGSLEEKDLDLDLAATAEKTQKDLEALAPTSAVKEIQTVPKEKTTTTSLASTKEIVSLLRDQEIKATQTKTTMRIKVESLQRTKTKTMSE